MKTIGLSVEEVSILSRLMPGKLEGCVYNTGTGKLECPNDIAAEIEAIIVVPDWKDADLIKIKTGLKELVDASAEIERLKFITPGAGQAMTYQQKVTEAQAFKSALNPQTADYPILSSEVGITAETLDDVADVVLAAFAQWQQVGAMIEGIRLGSKRDIDAAKDEAAARAISDAIIWPSK